MVGLAPLDLQEVTLYLPSPAARPAIGPSTTRIFPFPATNGVHEGVSATGERLMGVQRGWKRVGADPHHEEIERLHSELAAFNKRIAELEKGHDQSPMIETLKATATILSRQIDEVRCSIATEQLAGLLAK